MNSPMKYAFVKIIWILILIGCHEQDEQLAKPIIFAGKITTQFDSLKATVIYQEDSTTDWNTGKYFHVPIADDGSFKFVSAPLTHGGRISLTISAVEGSDYINSIYEPGDSIYLTCGTNEVFDFTNVQLSGSGVQKYMASRAIQLFKPEVTAPLASDYERAIRSADTIANAKLTQLGRYRDKIAPDVYQVMRLDIVSTVHHSLLYLCGYSVGSFSDEPQSDSVWNARKKIFDAVAKEKIDSLPPDDISVRSNEYTDFLYHKTKLELAIDRRENKTQFKDLYQKIKSDYNGILRDKLLTLLTLNGFDMAIYFGSSDPKDYTNCLKDASTTITIPWYRELVQRVFNSRRQGAEAFPFTFTADSSRKNVSLSDFKGKVVLLDVYPYSCTGCYLFSNAFHKKVYPYFKDNSEFQIVTVYVDMGQSSSEEKSREGYMRKLRGEGFNGYKMVHPEYTNLYGGKGVQSAREMEKHYNITCFPFLLLIDKNGKIYSSTLPFFTDEKNSNIESLKALIAKALAES